MLEAIYCIICVSVVLYVLYYIICREYYSFNYDVAEGHTYSARDVLKAVEAFRTMLVTDNGSAQNVISVDNIKRVGPTLTFNCFVVNATHVVSLFKVSCKLPFSKNGQVSDIQYVVT